MARLHISPFLWFDTQAEEAARFYVGIFPDSRVTEISRYPAAGQEVHGRPPGSVMTVAFELGGQPYTALNGGPHVRFNEAVSFVVHCADQAEVDRYWDKLGAGGPVEAQQCGWLKDRFGLSWQVVPKMMMRLLTDPDEGRRTRVFTAMMQMKKLDIAAIEKAAEGP